MRFLSCSKSYDRQGSESARHSLDHLDDGTHSELQNGVADEHQRGSETVEEGPEAIGAKDVQDGLKNVEFLLHNSLVGRCR